MAEGDQSETAWTRTHPDMIANAATTARSKRVEYLRIVLIFCITRAAIVIIGSLALTSGTSTSGPQYRHLDAPPALDMWFRWDAGIYSAIALDGSGWYVFHEPAMDAVFLPVYPQAIRGVNYLLGCSDRACTNNPRLQCRREVCAVFSGLIITNCALLAATLLIYHMTRVKYGAQIALRTGWLLMISPASIFLSGVYTEGLFLFFSTLSFFMLGWRKAISLTFPLAVLAATLASLTRLVGIVLCLPLIIYAVQQTGWRRVLYVLLALTPVLVLLGYLSYQDWVTGHPNTYFDSNRLFWTRSFTAPWITFWAYFYGKEPVSFWGPGLAWIDLIFTGIYLMLSAAAIWKSRLWGTFAFATVGVPILSGMLASMLRYGSASFPFYVVLAQLSERWYWRVVVFGLFTVLNIIFIYRFALWRFLV